MTKDFRGGFSALFKGKEKEDESESESEEKPSNRTALKNEDEVRATFIVKIDLLNKLKAIAYYDRALIKDVINKALDNYIKEFEDENGTKYLELKNSGK